MIKIFNFIKENTTKIVFGFVIGITITSCDPTIDALSYDLAEENSKEDLTGPTASFSYFQENNELDNTVEVTFSNSSSNANMFDWDFGNGETSTEREFTAVYDNPNEGNTASYEVTLVASDNLGATDSLTESITVIGFFREVQITDNYTLINTGEADDPVSILEFSSEQGLDADRTNFASNILDKNGGPGGATTVWTSNDELTGDGLGDGEYIIFDLGSEVELGLIRFSTNNQAAQYAFQILTSTTGTSDADFSILLPEGGTTATDWDFSDSANVELQDRELTTPTMARYVKLITFGRYTNADPTMLNSLWSNWAEIEFYSPNE